MKSTKTRNMYKNIINSHPVETQPAMWHYLSGQEKLLILVKFRMSQRRKLSISHVHKP